MIISSIFKENMLAWTETIELAELGEKKLRKGVIKLIRL